jgi:hypothetical protein
MGDLQMKDVLIVLAVMGAIIGGLVWAGLPYWAIFVGGLAIWLGIMEIVRRTREGYTLSQKMWQLRAQNPVVFWIVWGGMLAGFALLMVHLAWKAMPVNG